jgi:hypothetical protein
MYRQDLDGLVSFFQASCQRFTISDQNNRYESLDEMKANVGSKAKYLDIRGEVPGVHFLLNQKEEVKSSGTPTYVYFNELRTEELTDEAEALFLRIKEYLSTFERPRFRMPYLLISILSLIGIVIFAFMNGQELNGQIVLHGPSWLFIGLIVLLVVSLIISGSIQNAISLETKLNSPSFLERNREEFARHAVTAIISALVGWLVAHFSK